MDKQLLVNMRLSFELHTHTHKTKQITVQGGGSSKHDTRPTFCPSSPQQFAN